MRLTIQAGLLAVIGGLGSYFAAPEALAIDLVDVAKLHAAEVAALHAWSKSASPLLPKEKSTKRVDPSPEMRTQALGLLKSFPSETRGRDEASLFLLNSEFDPKLPFDDSWNWRSLGLQDRTAINAWAYLARIAGKPGVELVLRQAWQILQGYPSLQEVILVQEILAELAPRGSKDFLNLRGDLAAIHVAGRDFYFKRNADVVEDCHQTKGTMKKVKCSAADQKKLQKVQATLLRNEIEGSRLVARKMLRLMRESGLVK